MWQFGVSLLATVAFCILMASGLNFSSNSVPPLGEFLSPFHGFWQQAETAKPSDLTLELEGLEHTVEILFDDRLVPHIFAGSLHDAIFAQGYLEARYRLWQMDLSTRAAAGRVSEVLGERTLSYDIAQREMGLAYAAELALEVWRQYPEDFALLEAYSRGVNAYVAGLDRRDYPVEFKVMQYSPEKWSPLKTALYAKSMAQRLCSDESDLEYSNLRELLGDSTFRALYPAYNPHDAPVIPAGTPWPFTAQQVEQDGSAIPDTPAGDRGSGLKHEEVHEGSNNWVVNGSRTVSGKNILCNDPHLDLTLPSTWFELHLVTPGMNCYGMSLPGIPGITIGWNDHIAWGITNVGQDVLDWYTIPWSGESSETYIVDGKERQVTWRREVYRIKGKPDHVDSTAFTVWGPVQSRGLHAGLAMRWIAHDKPDATESAVFYKINMASNFEEFRNALEHFYAPAQNFLFADAKGNIGLIVAGRLPLRMKGTARRVLDGSSSVGWKSMIPWDHNPYTFNPDQGYAASANQQTTDTTYPYHYAGAPYFDDFRGRYINRKLASRDDFNVADMQALQMNTYSIHAEEAVPVMLAMIDPVDFSPELHAIHDSLVAWDYRYDANSRAATAFEIWWAIFENLVWDEIRLQADSIAVAYPEDWLLIDLCKNDPGNIFFDLRETMENETFGDVAQMAFLAMADSISMLGGQLAWGEYRKFAINHLGRFPGFGYPLDKLGGHGNALNAIKGVAGPSMRMIVEMQETPIGYVVYPGGQSGNPGSHWYDTGVGKWANGEYHKARVPRKVEDLDDPLFKIIME